MRVLLFLPRSPLLSSPMTPFLARPIPPPLRARCFHKVRSTDKDLAIFKNSLQRTLEAHRSSNRSRLIRRIPNKPDPKDTTDHSTTNHESSVVQPTAGTTSRPSAPKSPKRRSRSLGKDGPPSQPTISTRRWTPDPQTGRLEGHPWLDNLDLNRPFYDGLSQLNAEICALEKYFTPTPAEEDHVNRVVAELTRLLEGTVPHPPLVIGSWRTGFAMTHSGLDLLLPVPDEVRSIENIRKPSATRPKVLNLHRGLLRDVVDTLRQSPSFNDRVHLSTERGCITAVEARTGLKLHIFCGEGLPPIVEYVMDYRAEYPSLRPLYMTIRLILESQGLYGWCASSIRSEALVMLVVAFLKTNHGRFRRSDSLGERLLAFLHLYGIQIDLTTTGISVDPPDLFNADTLKKATKTYSPEDLPAHTRGQRSIMNLRKTAAARGNMTTATRLCLQNPTNYMDDLGRACVQTREFQSALESAHECLILALETWEKCKPINPNCSLLNRVLRVNFDGFNDVDG
ncbi:hypothetical protein BO71DRAFT_429272 [Aspergillus ellipticus CBS 707.79]|uniref:Polynucleotide adenylyltransferase n=1 Tax=Aspergillus ellipticus CBS 707.79 TaxID=1448320 RepID=A0A319DV59_9EURO|nr:hypothetical protein BO71DRAFT_429272 [Aspergillus ellipticus CBS 707.79]